MAQPAQIPFAIDTDITPLQGRFFESVTKSVSDPTLRSQLYDKVRSTFGGIQQARDIQKAKMQEDEDRSIGLELRRAQLDQSKMELGLARDKVRQQQNAVAKTQEFDSAFNDLSYELEGLDPEEAKKKLNLFGAQYADVLTYNPAAKAKLELTNNAFETRRQASTLPAGFINDLATINNDEQAEGIMPGISRRPDYQAAKAVAAQKQEAQKAKQLAASSLTVGSTAEALSDKLGNNVSDALEKDKDPNWGLINTNLKELDRLGFITPDQKNLLLQHGIKSLRSPKDVLPTKTNKTFTEGLNVLRDIAAEASAKALATKTASASKLLMESSTTEPAKKDVADLEELGQ